MDGLKMVEGPTAKAYAIKINSNFGNELVREVYARTKKAYIPAEKLVGKRFLGADSLGKNILFIF
jgi:hypothetical protein